MTENEYIEAIVVDDHPSMHVTANPLHRDHLVANPQTPPI